MEGRRERKEKNERMEKKKRGRSVDLISDCPGVLLRDGGGEGAEDLLQGQASILIQPKGRRHICTYK
jgi:hypothetical protein